MGYSSKQIIEARVEELIFALDVVENNDNPKLILLNKIDDLMIIVKERYNG